MNLAAFDVARCTGWAVGERVGRPIFGEFTLPGLDDANLQKSCASLYTAVFTVCRENDVKGAAIEAPLQAVPRKNSRGIVTPTSSHGVRVLTMLSGAAQAGAFNAGARLFWMPEPSHWRKAVFGSGFPENPKDVAIKYCKMAHKIDCVNPDAAEAIAILSYAHGQARLI